MESPKLIKLYRRIYKRIKMVYILYGAGITEYIFGRK